MNASTTGPKPRKRHRSANGTRRPYQDGKQWIAPKTFVLPDGSRATIRATGPTREQTLARLRQRVADFEHEAEKKQMAEEARSVGEWVQ